MSQRKPLIDIEYHSDDDKFMSEILDNSPLLFYGEFEVYLNKFMKMIFQHEFREYGFGDIKMDDISQTAYWFLISWLESQNMFEYGTSPRGGWLTEKGERFKKIIMENENALIDAKDNLINQ